MNNILVVADLNEHSDIAIRQALLLAATYKTSIHVVQFVYEKLIVESDDFETIKQQIVDTLANKLSKKLASSIGEQVTYSYEVVWQKNIHLWIDDYTEKFSPKLVVKTGHRSESFFYTPTDWHLIRECNAPVYIATDTKWRNSSNVIAAVDLETNNKVKIALNHQVLHHAKMLSENLKVALHVCYVPLVSTLLQDLGIQFQDDVELEARKSTAAIIDELAEQYQIPIEHFSVIAGKPEKVIPSVAAKHNAGVVVIGSVGRTGVRSKIIGNTAEDIMRLLKTDVFAIKP